MAMTDERPAAGERLLSLDALRGFTMFWLMGGKPFAVALAAVAGSGGWLIAFELDHSAWEGLRYYDLIWPCFMLMVGVSVAFSHGRHTAGQAWRRAAVLFLLGALRASLADNAPQLVELSSALQPIAVAYLAAWHLAGCRARVQIAVAGGILTGYALLLAPGGYVINQNLVTTVDLQVLGRAHKEGWGTVLSTLPTISTTLLGLLFGGVLRSGRTHRRKMAIFALTGLGCIAAGLALSPVVPVIMKLWTASYGLLSAGWAALLFLLFYWLVDVRQWRTWAFPLLVIGTNALAAYLGPSLVATRRVAGALTGPLARDLGAWGAVLTAGVALLLNWLILLWMYKRKIFLRA
jgi:predicted acyltransferase